VSQHAISKAMAVNSPQVVEPTTDALAVHPLQLRAHMGFHERADFLVAKLGDQSFLLSLLHFALGLHQSSGFDLVAESKQALSNSRVDVELLQRSQLLCCLMNVERKIADIFGELFPTPAINLTSGALKVVALDVPCAGHVFLSALASCFRGEASFQSCFRLTYIMFNGACHVSSPVCL